MRVLTPLGQVRRGRKPEQAVIKSAASAASLGTKNLRKNHKKMKGKLPFWALYKWISIEQLSKSGIPLWNAMSPAALGERPCHLSTQYPPRTRVRALRAKTRIFF